MIYSCEYGTIEYRTPTITDVLCLTKAFGSSLQSLSTSTGTLTPELVDIYLKLMDVFFKDYVVSIDLTVDGEKVDSFDKVNRQNVLMPDILQLCTQFLSVCFGSAVKKK